ncbi:thiamine-phosphate kinase [Sphingopyxis sp. MWB1]|uniref:thiamine-phosphate kinase n=1 Tax=Sphingopyxis sp. MWB1 TaxID=1537715 RepID=UPI001186CA09|nr:thiamine-phosphate kinase [Sphingopyxis sp. MWB1]
MPDGLKMSDVGEKAFLAKLLPTLSVDPAFVNGFGHDASVMDIGLPETDLVMKIDRAAKPISALNGWSDYRVWGRMAVTANCSDILTVGGRPRGFMLSLSMQDDTPVDVAEAIVAGAAEECQRHGVAFLGGDTKEAMGMNVVGAALGTIDKNRHFNRRGGKAGDLLVLAGTVGGFLGAYRTCQAGGFPEPDAVEYLSRPRAAWKEALALASLEGVRSACDLSDGLSSSALSVVGSGAGAVLNFDALPFHPLARASAATRGVDLLSYAFGVGDWGILYAVDPSAGSAIADLKAKGLSLAIVGLVESEPGLRLRRGHLFAISASENEHFRQRMEDEGDYFDLQESSLVLTSLVP